MDEEEFNALVDKYIAFELSVRGSKEYAELFPVFEQVDDMCQDDPDSTLKFILAALEKNSSKEIMENLSAGLLEDLLAKHGRYLIENVEEEAKVNGKFSSLLGGVWKNRIDEDIWVRMKAVRDRRGWDGVPDA